MFTHLTDLNKRKFIIRIKTNEGSGFDDIQENHYSINTVAVKHHIIYCFAAMNIDTAQSNM